MLGTLGKERKHLHDGDGHAYKISKVSRIAISGSSTPGVRVKKAKVNFDWGRVRNPF